MLHDEAALDQAVDSEAALEFLKEASKLAASDELAAIGLRLEEKSQFFRERLLPDAIENLDESGLKELARHIFGFRRRIGKLIDRYGIEVMRQQIILLLHGPGPLAERFTTFVLALGGIEEPLAASLASELLHFTFPEKYWLWTPWIWHRHKDNGALPLLLQPPFQIAGSSPGQRYESLGKALATVNTQAPVRDLPGYRQSTFGPDIFLACVYAVYMYTVFRVKLSREFNRVLPELPEMAQRVLGVRHMGTA